MAIRNFVIIRHFMEWKSFARTSLCVVTQNLTWTIRIIILWLSRLSTSAYNENYEQYAVKVQRSLAPLSWFPGSRKPTAHVHQCCRFQSYAKSRRLHAITNEIYKRNLHCVNHIPGIHDNGPPRTTLWRLTLTAYIYCWKGGYASQSTRVTKYTYGFGYHEVCAYNMFVLLHKLEELTTYSYKKTIWKLSNGILLSIDLFDFVIIIRDWSASGTISEGFLLIIFFLRRVQLWADILRGSESDQRWIDRLEPCTCTC